MAGRGSSPPRRRSVPPHLRLFRQRAAARSRDPRGPARHAGTGASTAVHQDGRGRADGQRAEQSPSTAEKLTMAEMLARDSSDRRPAPDVAGEAPTAQASRVDLSDPETFVSGVPHEAFRKLRLAEPVSWQDD